jgi:predicted metal-dependent phosphoesterase TrpH
MMRTIGAILALLVAFVAFGGTEQTARPKRTTITKRYTPADQVKGRYQYVPFDVPQDTGTLRVRYEYDRAGGDNVVDLGVFEPGPLTLNNKSFRGYSGGARSEFEITTRRATPGYVPGRISIGRWSLLLGLYRVSAKGVEVKITVETSPQGFGERPDNWSTLPLPPKAAARWYLGALHTHTTHSDGTLSVRDLASQFRAKRFDFVAITDHNNTTHSLDFEFLSHQAPPLLITGEEVTTPGGHASLWGLPQRGWVDFRVLPGDAAIRDLVAAARAQGAMFSVNHPASECLACGWTHEFVDGIAGIEISNGRHGEVEKAIAMWDKLLLSGRRITGVGSSDWHSSPNRIDNANARVYALTLTQEAILDAIRAGRVIVMTNAEDPTPDVRVSADTQSAIAGEVLKLATDANLDVHVTAVGAPAGQVHVVLNGKRVRSIPLNADAEGDASVPAAPGYVRFEIVKADGSAFAYTNPVYLVRP